MTDLTEAKMAAAAVELPEGFHVILTDNAVEPWGPDDDPGLAINVSFQHGEVVVGRLTILDWEDVKHRGIPVRVTEAILGSIETITTELGNLAD